MTTKNFLFSIAGAVCAVLLTGLLYALLWLANIPAPKCPFEGNECPNAREAMRDYQIELWNDSTVIFDGERRVGTMPFDSTQAFDKLMIEDNQ